MDILILEDSTYRIGVFIEKFSSHNLTITDTSCEVIDHLKVKVFDYIFIDNDLGYGNGCGTDVASYLYYNPTNLNNQANIIVHSWNRPATESILSMLPNAQAIPFNTEGFFGIEI